MVRVMWVSCLLSLSRIALGRRTLKSYFAGIYPVAP
jgi:hypothetical protein